MFSIRSAYNLQTTQPIIAHTVAVSALWNKEVPLKVVLFAWRLFRDRLPTKDSLLRRGVISFDSRLCVAGCDSEETSSHLFLHCNSFGSVWHLILRWMGLSRQQFLLVWVIISISLPLMVVSCKHVVQFYRLFGLQLRGKFGKKEITDYSMAKKAQFLRWLIKLSRSHSCGRRRNFLLFPSIIMVGCLVHSPFWA